MSHATINPSSSFVARKEAEAIRKALDHMVGCDEDAMIDVLGNNTGVENKLVHKEYKVLFGRDLTEDIKKKASGNFEDALLARLKTRAEFDAWALHHAMAGAGTDEHAIIEILATRSNADIAAIRTEYKTHYGKELEDAIIGDLSGDIKRLLVSLVQGCRAEGVPVNKGEAEEAAKELFGAGEGQWGTDESKFNQLLVTLSFEQIKAVNHEYLQIKGQDLVTAIEQEMSGNLKAGFLAIVLASINKEKYFADKLYHSMKGAGTDDRTLIRIVASRCEVDLVDIKREFAEKYHKALARFISEDCGGDYKKLLVKIVGPN